MATSASNAYSVWRQYAGDARPSQGQTRAGLRAVTSQEPIHTGQTISQAVDNSLQALAGFARNYQQVQDNLEQEADTKVKEWMRTKTVSEYREAMRLSATPFQEDPLAMAALQRNAGAALAFEVEERIQNEVKQGKYRTTEEADKARIDALNGARNTWSKDMGISAENPAFLSGFGIQQDERRAAIHGLQQDVTDKNLRQQALLHVNTSISAPLTPGLIASSGPQFAADYVVNVVAQAQATGQLRSQEDVMGALNHSINSLTGVSGGADVLMALGDKPIDIQGVKGTLKGILGEGAFDAMVLKARDAENTMNAGKFGQFQSKVLELTRNRDLMGVNAMIAATEKESGGKTTRELESLYRTRAAVVESLDYERGKLAEKVAREQEDLASYQSGMEGYTAFLSGSLVSGNPVDLGFKDAAQARKGEQEYLENIADPQQRIQTAIKLAGKFPDGFSSSALTEWNRKGKMAFDVYSSQVQNGNANAVVPSDVQNMLNVYEADPVAFGLAFGDKNSYVELHNAGKATGQSLADMVKAKARWDGLPKATRDEADKEMKSALSSIKGGQEEYVSGSVKGIASGYMAAGVSATVAVDYAMDRFKEQHIDINNSYVHKSFFTDNSKDTAASQFAESVFKDSVMPRLLQSIGNPSDYAIRYSPTDRSVWVVDLVTGSPIQYSREQMLEDADKEAEVLRLQGNLKKTTTIESLREPKGLIQRIFSRD